MDENTFKRNREDEGEEDEEAISRINQKLKTCTYNYLEHKIQKVCDFRLNNLFYFHFNVILITLND